MTVGDASETRQALLRAILESPRDIVIFALDREYRYLAFNDNHRRTMKAIWDVDIEIGKSMLEVIGRDDDRGRARANFDRALGGEYFTVLEHYGEEELSRRYYEDTYSPIVGPSGDVIGLTVFLTDVTDKQTAHAKKLESLGLLAGGVAHDFNNLLVGILGNVELALRELSPGAAAYESCDRVKTAAVRAAELVSQMLAYSGKSRMVAGPVDISQLVEEMARLLEVSMSRRARLVLEIARDLPPVEADAGQLRQVVMNLITNASDAVDQAGGTITVRTFAIDATREMLSATFVDDALAPGPYVCIETIDTGVGMDARAKAKLFDPFFTTKIRGRGLGLASVLGIVRAHKGAIAVESEPGRGSRFRVMLPCVERELAPERRSTPQLDWRASGTVLVADDEPIVRRALARMLEELGFSVIEATDGQQAFELATRHRGKLAAIVADLTMVGLGGRDLLRTLREASDEVPMIISSGYSPEGAALDLRAHSHVAFMQKPYDLATLVRTMRTVLGR